MPHTSRKTRAPVPAQKRLQVTDADGWTHVTSGGNVRRVMRSTRPPRPSNDTTQSSGGDDHDHAKQVNERAGPQPPGSRPVLTPAEAPSRLTLAELQAQFRAHRRKWEDSETWQRLREDLTERLGARRRALLAEGGEGRISTRSRRPIDAVVCIGLGSPSGFLRDGWVDRRTVSLYQLAALASIKDHLTHPDHPDRGPDRNETRSFPVFAQDPVFNALDRALLASLGIVVLEHPAAFARLTPDTVLFCPGAERTHLELLLPSRPWLVFGGPLEDRDSAAIQAYVAGTGSRGVRPFPAHEHAFWNARLYFWRDGPGG